MYNKNMLKSLLQKQQIDALKSGDSQKLEFLRYILSEIKNKEIDKKQELTDDEIKAVLDKIVKELDDSIKAAKTGGRNELQVKYEAQKEIISSISK